MPAKSTSAKSTAKTPRGRKVSARETSAITKASDHGTSDNGLTVYHEASWLPEHRPIASSSLKIASTYGGALSQRPIEASPDFAGTYQDAATRPIGVNDFTVSRTINMSGNRPIMKSSLAVFRTEHSYGEDRPVASNNIDGDPAELMGYLD